MNPRTRIVVPTIEPIIVVPGSPPLHDPRWIYEPKFDGFRGVLYVCRGEGREIAGEIAGGTWCEESAAEELAVHFAEAVPLVPPSYAPTAPRSGQW